MAVLISGALMVALITGLAGFGGLAGEATAEAQMLFVASASVSTALLLLRAMRWRVPPS